VGTTFMVARSDRGHGKLRWRRIRALTLCLLAPWLLTGCTPVDDVYVKYENAQLTLVSRCPGGFRGPIEVQGVTASGGTTHLGRIVLATPVAAVNLSPVKIDAGYKSVLVVFDPNKFGIEVPVPPIEGQAYSYDSESSLTERLKRPATDFTCT